MRKLMEGLRASDIRLGETYVDETEAQFPAETLAFRTGSSRDLALLFASGLEGVGILSAFIETDNDFLVALNLNVGQAAAETLFNGLNGILVIDDEVWVPLSMNAFNEGFMAAWTRGAQSLNNAFAAGQELDFVIVGDAWAFYPPAPLPGQERNIIRTDTDQTAREVNRAMQQYIDREITPIIQRTSAAAQGNPALQNRLGILNVRAGRIADGKAAYERAAALGSIAAMTNRGNLALTEGDFPVAERWFRQALERDSGNRAAQRGLERVAGSR